MRFYKEIHQAPAEKSEYKMRMMSKASKLSIKSRGYVFPPQKISKEDFQNLGKTSKKFGQSQAYKYSDKASNQINGGRDQSSRTCSATCTRKPASSASKRTATTLKSRGSRRTRSDTTTCTKRWT